MEREVGGGIGMGKTCKLKDVSFQCMTKKKKKKTLKKLYKKKKKKERKVSVVSHLYYMPALLKIQVQSDPNKYLTENCFMNKGGL